jgi:hypothetical protein
MTTTGCGRARALSSSRSRSPTTAESASARWRGLGRGVGLVRRGDPAMGVLMESGRPAMVAARYRASVRHSAPGGDRARSACAGCWTARSRRGPSPTALARAARRRRRILRRAFLAGEPDAFGSSARSRPARRASRVEHACPSPRTSGNAAQTQGGDDPPRSDAVRFVKRPHRAGSPAGERSIGILSLTVVRMSCPGRRFGEWPAHGGDPVTICLPLGVGSVPVAWRHDLSSRCSSGVEAEPPHMRSTIAIDAARKRASPWTPSIAS